MWSIATVLSVVAMIVAIAAALFVFGNAQSAMQELLGGIFVLAALLAWIATLLAVRGDNS